MRRCTHSSAPPLARLRLRLCVSCSSRLAQVRGTKRLLLFPPSDLPYLYYTPRVKGTLRYQWPNNFSRVPPSPAAARRFGGSGRLPA